MKTHTINMRVNGIKRMVNEEGISVELLSLDHATKPSVGITKLFLDGAEAKNIRVDQDVKVTVEL